MDIANLQRQFAKHRNHPAAIVGLCASPVILLGGIWMLVNAWVLTPGIPGDSAPAEACVDFAIDPAGLPRLQPQEQAAFVETHLSRIIHDVSFRDALMTSLRRQPPKEQAAFRAHVFDALLPRFVQEAQTYHEMPPEEVETWLEDRLVYYKRMGHMLRNMRLSADDFDSRWTDEKSLLELVMARTTAEQRTSCGMYFVALARVSSDIKDDPERQAQFEQRISETGK